MGDLSEHFDRKEFACQCGCGFDSVNPELITVLEDVRMFFKSSVHINSGCRCKKHNAKVGGEPNSQHILGNAADIVVKGIKESEVASYLEKKYPNKYGIGRYKGRTHIDVRQKKARWKR